MIARRITLFLHERIGVQEDPRRFGAALKRAGAAESVPLWRYRVGDWRIVVHIEDDTLRVLIVRIAHRPGGPIGASDARLARVLVCLAQEYSCPVRALRHHPFLTCADSETMWPTSKPSSITWDWSMSGIVTHDVGPWIVQPFARQNPDRVAGIFFFDCPYGRFDVDLARRSDFERKAA